MPSGPIMFSAGTRTSWNWSEQVSLLRMPSLSSLTPVKPSIPLDDEATDPARLLVGLRVDQVVVCGGAVGDPVLRAVDHPLVAVADRAGRMPAGPSRPRAPTGERGRDLSRSRSAAGSAPAAPPSRAAGSAASRAPGPSGSARSTPTPSPSPRPRRGASAFRSPCRRTPRRTAARARPARRRACAGPTGTRPSRRSRPRAARPAPVPSAGSRAELGELRRKVVQIDGHGRRHGRSVPVPRAVQDGRVRTVRHDDHRPAPLARADRAQRAARGRPHGGGRRVRGWHVLRPTSHPGACARASRASPGRGSPPRWRRPHCRSAS